MGDVGGGIHTTFRFGSAAGPVRALCPVGALLASGGEDGAVRLWDPATGRQLRTYTGHTGAVLSLCVLHDHVVSAGADGTVRVWGSTVLRGHTADVTCVTAVGGRLVSTSEDGTVRFWDPSTGAGWSYACLQVGGELLVAVEDNLVTMSL